MQNTHRHNVKFYGFIGIPYAAPPVGKLRFMVSKEFITKGSLKVIETLYLNAQEKNRFCFKTRYIIIYSLDL